MIFYPVKAPLNGSLQIPGDKSISHRAVMIGSIAEGTTLVSNFLSGEDCLTTISALRTMGVPIQLNRITGKLKITGNGLSHLSPAFDAVYCGNSGTTIRLLAGLFSGRDFSITLTGDDSLQKRPMKRILDPLKKMGASIESLKKNDRAPLLISPSKLTGISYDSPVASAQVKSCILLAGLSAKGETTITEPAPSRDHTERMLRSFGADLSVSGRRITLHPGKTLKAQELTIPGDLSSAAYFIAAALLVPGSLVLLKNVGINPTRDGILRVLKKMGASIEQQNPKNSGGEPSADLLIRSSSLHGVTIEGELIPNLIDELPILAIAGAAASGMTIIRDAAELRVKESDRIQVMTENLKKMGADITATEDGFIIRGGRPLKGALIHPAGDHRIVMSFAVASLIAEGPTEIEDAEAAKISYPQFFRDLNSLRPVLQKEE